MKKLILIIAFIFFGIIGISQAGSKTFHLKNGSIITGVVIEEIPGKEYKVKTKDGNIFVFKADEISKITLNTGSNKSLKKPQDELPEGKFFYNLNELGIGGMFYGDDATYNIGVSTINGINLNNQFYLGLGLELQTSGIGNFIPIYLDLRLNFAKTRNTFYTYINAGYSISGRNENITVVQPGYWGGTTYQKAIHFENGFLGRLGFGYKLKMTDKLNANVSMFYTAQSYSANVWLYDQIYFKAQGTYSTIGVKIGIGIK